MKKLSISSGCLLAFGLAFASTAHADLSYVQTTASSFGGMSGMGASTKYFSKGQKQRIETSVMGSNNISLTQCGSASSTQIDTKNRVYTVYSIGPKMPSPKPNGKPMSVSVNFKITNLGTESVNGQKAPHYKIDMNATMNGRPMNITTEIWSSNTPMPSCPGMSKEAAEQLTKNLAMFRGGNVKVNGDIKSLGSIYRMVPLRQKVSMRGMEFATINTTKISGASLPATLFGVPAGYRQVSNAQFESIQQQAMKAKMGDIFKSMPKMGSMPKFGG